MEVALAIRRDLIEADDLRRLARRERDRRTATRTLATANALEGMTRAEAARLAGLERQALRDAELRLDVEGLDGLRDRPKSRRPPALTEGEQAVLRATVFRKSRPVEGGGEWTLPRLCAWIEGRFGKRLHPASLSRIVRGLDLSRQKTRPVHPRSNPRAQAAFAKGGCAAL